MHERLERRPQRPAPSSSIVGVFRLGLLLLPCVLLAVGSVLQAVSGKPGLLWVGALFVLLGCPLALANGQGWRQPVGPAVLLLYVIALSWLLLTGDGTDVWFQHLAQSLLLIVPLGFFGIQCLRESGAPALRRARALAARLSQRTDWPADLDACRLLPDVKALREALHVDASPALTLLGNPRPQVRVAALAALEFRQSWRHGQPEVVLSLARNSREPEVRAAAVYALANIHDRHLIESLAEFLHDPSPLVRRAATDALLWDPEEHWGWIRHEFRKALGDPVCQDDGPIRNEGHLLTGEAVDDLTGWAAEKGLLAVRAALTLADHYARALAAGGSPGLVAELRRQVADPHAPGVLRLEIARLLLQHRELTPDLQQRIIDPGNPAPLRLIGVDAVLARGESSDAVNALRELARLPNREIALATADVVQRRLNFDLGLPRNQPLPPAHSRLATEVARRVLAWAGQVESAVSEIPTEPPTDDISWRSLSEL